jgi:hypothetical protein
MRQSRETLDALASTPTRATTCNYEDARGRHREAMENLIKFQYSSGEFIDQYVAGSTEKKKCLICQ